HKFGDRLAAAVDSVRAARKARGEAPVEGGGVMGEGRCRDDGGAGGDRADSGLLEKRTALHRLVSCVPSVDGALPGVPARRSGSLWEPSLSNDCRAPIISQLDLALHAGWPGPARVAPAASPLAQGGGGRAHLLL